MGPIWNLPSPKRVRGLLGLIWGMGSAADRTSRSTSLNEIARALNECGIRTPRGAEWQPVQVKRVLEQTVAQGRSLA